MNIHLISLVGVRGLGVRVMVWGQELKTKKRRPYDDIHHSGVQSSGFHMENILSATYRLFGSINDVNVNSNTSSSSFSNLEMHFSFMKNSLWFV
jgi:hypothetical protein